MIFEHLVRTGFSSVSGCQSVANKSNYVSCVNNGAFSFDTNEVTGEHSSNCSLNSQTLIEDSFSKTVLPLTTIINSSGDYFIDTGYSQEPLYGQATTGFPILIPSFSKVLYEGRDYSPAAIYVANTTGSVATGLMSAISGKIPLKTGALHELLFFANGQKMISGESYSLASSNSLFIYQGDATGKFFAYPKSDFYSRTGVSGDLYGTPFIENNTDLYYAGMEQDPSLFLEINTGVNLVVTGVVAKVSLDNYIQISSST